MGLVRSSGTGTTTMGDIPNTLEAELNLLGLIPPRKPENEKPKVERDYTFKMPTLDENGDPPW